MNGPTDWPQTGFPDNTLPDSCCKELPSPGKCDLNSVHIYDSGCMVRLQGAIESSALILGGVGVGIAVVQVISKSC